MRGVKTARFNRTELENIFNEKTKSEHVAEKPSQIEASTFANPARFVHRRGGGAPFRLRGAPSAAPRGLPADHGRRRWAPRRLPAARPRRCFGRLVEGRGVVFQNFGIFANVSRACSGLCRNQMLQAEMQFVAFFKLYKICVPLQPQRFSQKSAKTLFVKFQHF